ncbi:hypothetical protein [Metapseudomonas boanensis]|uniref:Uncharacterized protein n=1 Tax=Metapseudomonas boanensis TaxID=2822138 RepID=A0ABS5XI43_9GAMM|nr:hypothetical protein [Pseudomonas boanensis]MBT8767335.1 hypothetical protein [Pseudomonas boanensis]
MIRGIALPIAFYRSHGKKLIHKEIQIYFSFEPIPPENKEFLHNGDLDKRLLSELINKSYPRGFDFLVPYKITKGLSYEVTYGVRHKIAILDLNPTTATLRNHIGLMPCSHNNLQPLLEAFGHPDFYLESDTDSIKLHVKSGNRYFSIPSQSYSPNCWAEFAHPSIILEGRGQPVEYEEINWNQVISDITMYSHEIRYLASSPT